MTERKSITVESYCTRPGSRFPAGATVLPDGVNFCIFGRHATRVELLLYAQADSPEPLQVIALSHEVNRTFMFWHVFVEGLPPGICYTWRVDGPTDIQHTGRCFNWRKELLDPWASRDRCGVGPTQGGGPAGCRTYVTARVRDGTGGAKPGHKYSPRSG